MTITIFGASGRTGKYLVSKALEKGYFVKAFVRDRSRLPIKDPKLTLIEGNLHNVASVDLVIAGSDAVLSALGWTRKSRKDVLSEAAANIVAAMEKHNIRRIIALTGYGVRFPKDPPDSLSKKLLHLAINITLPHLVPDGIQYAKTITESRLDWTVVRASMLSNRKGRGSFRVGYFDPGITMIPREDVADFMVKQVTEGKYVREAPVIA